MGKIEKIIKKGSVEGQTTEVYPVTSTKAVYDENNKRLDNIITGLQESVYDVVYKNKLTSILQEIDLTGTDADRKAKLDQFAVDWKALTGADTLDGAKFVGYSGEPDDFYGIFIYNSSIKGYSAIATSAHLSTYQVIILSTGTIISTSLFYHLEPVIIKTGNTDSDIAENVAAIQKYANNLTFLGIDIYNGFTIPVSLTGNEFCGYLIFNKYHEGDRIVLSGTVFFKGIVKNIVIDEGRYEEIVDITGTNPLNTTSDNMVDAINEVNTLAKSKGNGTITEVRMNGVSKGTSGVVDLGTVITAHQDISGKVDKTLNAKAFEAITILTSNTAEAMNANKAAVQAYVNNLTELGVDTTKGFNVPVRIDDIFYGCLTSRVINVPGGEGYFLSGTIFYVGEINYIKDICIAPTGWYVELVNIKNDNDLNTTSKDLIGAINEVNTLAKNKQDKLTSGTNIKTINNQSLLGSGNIEISAPSITVDTAISDTSMNPVQNKVIKAYIDGLVGNVATQLAQI